MFQNQPYDHQARYDSFNDASASHMPKIRQGMQNNGQVITKTYSAGQSTIWL